MRDREEAALALHRFGLGPRPGDIDRIAADPLGALKAELDGPEPAFGNGLPSTPTALADIRRVARQRRELRASSKQAQAASEGDGAGMGSDDSGESRRSRRPTPAQSRIYRKEIAARLRLVKRADIGFTERLVAFWTNHLTVRAIGFPRGLVGAFEREAIRPHIRGRFEDMLMAATKHPAMLMYLNGARSVGPNSRAGQRRGIGLNENHARELLELHTVGVDSGYTQEDVAALARILTGWTFGRDNPRGLGLFMFRPGSHEPGAQTVMGVRYDQPGVEQGEAAVRDLARHPSTGRRIATQLATYFVADEPPPELVQTLAEVFTKSGGDLRAMAFTLIDADGAWIERSKVKSPQEFLWSAMRGLDLSPGPREAIQLARALGQPFWEPASPQGFSVLGSTWLAPDAFADRLEVSERLVGNSEGLDNPADLLDAVLGPRVSEETRNGVRQAQSREQGLALLLMSPEFQRR